MNQTDYFSFSGKAEYFMFDLTTQSSGLNNNQRKI